MRRPSFCQYGTEMEYGSLLLLLFHFAFMRTPFFPFLPPFRPFSLWRFWYIFLGCFFGSLNSCRLLRYALICTYAALWKTFSWSFLRSSCHVKGLLIREPDQRRPTTDWLTEELSDCSLSWGRKKWNVKEKNLNPPKRRKSSRGERNFYEQPLSTVKPPSSPFHRNIP